MTNIKKNTQKYLTNKFTKKKNMAHFSTSKASILNENNAVLRTLNEVSNNLVTLNNFSKLKNVLIALVQKWKENGKTFKINFNEKSISIFKQSKGFGIEKLELPLIQSPQKLIINSLNFLKLIRSPLNTYYFKNNKTFFIFEPKIVRMASCIILSQILASTYDKMHTFKMAPEILPSQPTAIIPEKKKSNLEQIKAFLFKLLIAFILSIFILCIITYILKYFGLVDYHFFEILGEKISEKYQDFDGFIDEFLNNLLSKSLRFPEYREFVSMELKKLADRIRNCFKDVKKALKAIKKITLDLEHAFTDIKKLRSDLESLIAELNETLDKLKKDVQNIIGKNISNTIEKEEFFQEVRKAVAKQFNQLMKEEKKAIEKDTIELVHNLSKEYLSRKTNVTDILP